MAVRVCPSAPRAPLVQRLVPELYILQIGVQFVGGAPSLVVPVKHMWTCIPLVWERQFGFEAHNRLHGRVAHPEKSAPLIRVRWEVQVLSRPPISRGTPYLVGHQPSKLGTSVMRVQIPSSAPLSIYYPALYMLQSPNEYES